jgi:hypothetical protein
MSPDREFGIKSEAWYLGSGGFPTFAARLSDDELRRKQSLAWSRSSG